MSNASSSFLNQEGLLKLMMTQKETIYRNNICLATALQCLQLIVSFICQLIPYWVFIDSIHFGLMHQQGHIRVQYQLQFISGLVAFIIFQFANFQSLMIIYLKIGFILRITEEGLQKGNKFTRFKTLHLTIFYTNLFGLMFWTAMTLIHLGVYYHEPMIPGACYYVFIGMLMTEPGIHCYFNHYKAKIKNRQIFNNLLNNA